MIEKKIDYPQFDCDEDKARELGMSYAELAIEVYKSDAKLDLLAGYCVRFEVENLEWAIEYCRDYLRSSDIVDILKHTIAQSCVEANGY